MPKPLRLIRLIVCAGLGLLGVWTCVLGSSRQKWPTIENPMALRREATLLCRGEGGWRELQPVEYPPAMLKLNPQSINVSGERVYVALVPMAGEKRFHGFYIWPDATARSDSGIEREESDRIETPGL